MQHLNEGKKHYWEADELIEPVESSVLYSLCTDMFAQHYKEVKRSCILLVYFSVDVSISISVSISVYLPMPHYNLN